MFSKKNVAVIGGGSWATAIVKILSQNLNKIYWWIYEEEIVEHIKRFHHNPQYLSSVQFTISKLIISNNFKKIMSKADVVIFAVPSVYLKEVLLQLDKSYYSNKIIVSAIKGVIPEDNVMVGDFFIDKLKINKDNFATITGPCHAEEIALERLSYLTISCSNSETANNLASLIESRFSKTTISNDVHGTEYAAVLKNIFAIASGICNGLGYGDNFQAVLISNAIQEIKRFVDAVHPLERDISKSAYLGDLLVTAYSQFSRNRYFGNLIGKGYSVKYAKDEMQMVAEGYYAVKGVKEMNKKYNIDLPIVDAVYNVLYEKIAPRIEFRILADNLS